MIIRPADISDAATIAALHVHGWQSSYRGLVPDAYLDKLSIEQKTLWWQNKLQNEKARELLLLEQQGHVVGFCSFGPRDTPLKSDQGRMPRFAAEIYAIYLHADIRRTGMGTKLLAAAAQKLQQKHFGGLVLWVLVKNLPAVAFYKKLGGQPLEKKSIEIGGVTLTEQAYGFAPLTALIAKI